MLLGGKHWAREGDERSAGRGGQLRRPSYRYRYRYRYRTVATCRRPLRQDETLVGPGGRVFAGGQVGLLWCGRRRRGGLEGEDLSESGSRRCVCQRPRSCCTEPARGESGESGERRRRGRSLYLSHRGIVLYVLYVLYTTQQKGRARAGTVALEGNGQTYGLPQVVMDYCAGWVPRLSLGGVVVGAEPDRDGYDRRGGPELTEERPEQVGPCDGRARWTGW